MAFRRRVLLLFMGAAVAVGVIWLRMLQLQVVEGGTWRAEARSCRQRARTISAPRGRILDRDGVVLARDEPVPQLALVAAEWQRRARRRCTACGSIHYHVPPDPGRRPPRRTCPCKDPSARLEPLPPGQLERLEELLELPRGRLAELADLRLEEIRRLARERRARLERSGRPSFLVLDDVTQYEEDLMQRRYVVVPRITEEAVRLLELDEDGAYRGFHVKRSLRRVYPDGGPAGQMLGYVSVVQDRDELRSLRRSYGPNVTLDTRVGRAGLERAEEALLLGRRGTERLARDGDGTFTISMGEERPERGKTLRLGLTVEACRVADEVLQKHGDAEDYWPKALPSGGFVAMHANTGAIIAWGELPRLVVSRDIDRLFSTSDKDASFDRAVGQWVPPEGAELRRGETLASWRLRLSKPAPLHLSRVSQIAVEPGSTLKVLIAMGLLDGLAHMPPGTRLPLEQSHQAFPCGGHTASKPSCHTHRSVDLVGAIEVSCNKYFAYSLRDFPAHWSVYRHTVPALLGRFGLGRPSGVDVWGEDRGIFLQEWVDFDPRRPIGDAAAAARESHGLETTLRAEPGLPALVAGRDPGRLERLLAELLRQGAETFGADRALVQAGRGEKRERFVELRFRLAFRPHPEGPGVDQRGDAADRFAASFERRVERLGGRVEKAPVMPGSHVFAFRLVYHEAIGRSPDEPPVILRDDGRNFAIGQGPITVTPLQMARAMAALANGGRLVRPHLVRWADDARLTPASEDMGLDRVHLGIVRDGMAAVTDGVEGTARRAGFSRVPATVYGKTGTSQPGGWWLPGGAPDRGPWHHWFVGFAEAPGMPPIAFACVLHARLEEAAGLTSAKACAEFLQWWFTEGPDVR